MSAARIPAAPAGPSAGDVIDALTTAGAGAPPEHRLEGDGTLVVQVAAAAWRPAAETLARLGLSRLEFLTCVDWDDLLRLTLQVYSPDSRLVVRQTADLPRDDACIPSVSDLWPTVGWEERETYDQFGVRFSGHPDLRRILNPEAWDGHPLRRDYVDHVDITRPQYF